MDYLPLVIVALCFTVTAVFCWAMFRERRLAQSAFLQHQRDEAQVDRQFKFDLLEATQTNLLEEIQARADAERKAAEGWSQAGSPNYAQRNNGSDEPEDAIGKEIPLDDYRTP